MSAGKKGGHRAGFMTGMGLVSSGSTKGGRYRTQFSGSGKMVETSKITSKGQLTLPKRVRDALGADEGDKVRFVLRKGHVLVERAPDEPAGDPAIGAFLDLLEGSIPSAGDFPVELAEAMRALTAGAAFDPDEAIDGDVAL